MFSVGLELMWPSGVRIRTFLEELEAASLRSRHRRRAHAIDCGTDVSDGFTGYPWLRAGWLLSAQHVSSAGLSSPEICANCCSSVRRSCGCRLDSYAFSNRKGALISPQQSPDYSGVDGPRASEVCSPREVVGPTSVAMDCYERSTGVAGLSA